MDQGKPSKIAKIRRESVWAKLDGSDRKIIRVESERSLISS